MTDTRGFLMRMSLATRLLIGFLFVSIVPCLILTGASWRIAKQAVEKMARNNLMVISESKASRIESFALERRRDLLALSRIPGIVEAAATIAEGVDNPRVTADDRGKVKDRYRPLLGHITESFGYSNFYLFSPEGDLLVRYRRDLDVGTNLLTGPLKSSEMANVFDRVRTLLQPEMSDYQIYPGLNQPAAFIAGPILKGGAPVAFAILQIGNEQIYQIVNDYSGLGETGETALGARIGNKIVIVAPMRSDPDAAFHREAALGDKSLTALQKATGGERGFGIVKDLEGHDILAAWNYLPSFRWGMVVKQSPAEAYELVYRQRNLMYILLASIILPAGLLALWNARSISRPISLAAKAAERIAEGDLSQRVNIQAPGEVGALIAAIESMTSNLCSLIGRVQRSSIALVSTATEIAATSRQQEQTIAEFGSSTNQAAAAVKQISATSQELLKTMTEVSALANQTAATAATGQGSLGGMDKTMHVLADSTTSISNKLSVISERASNINLIVTTITKVADQTNLLSINAAIEAEKAGEYGLGFLVVAREIRRLADQTAVATLDIERMVKEMQTSVSAGVMEMDKFSEQVRQGVVDVAKIGEQLGRIIQAVQGLTFRFDQVTEGMTVQSQGADQIREAVIRINEGAGRTSQSLKEFNTATGHMREAVSSLKDEVSKFTIGFGAERTPA